MGILEAYGIYGPVQAAGVESTSAKFFVVDDKGVY